MVPSIVDIYLVMNAKTWAQTTVGRGGGGWCNPRYTKKSSAFLIPNYFFQTYYAHIYQMQYHKKFIIENLCESQHPHPL